MLVFTSAMAEAFATTHLHAAARAAFGRRRSGRGQLHRAF